MPGGRARGGRAHYPSRMLRGFAGMLSVWLVGAVALRAVVVPPERCPAVTVASAHEAVLESAAWMERALNADGTYVYEYDADDDSLSAQYNVVRHAGVTMSLYMLAAHGEPTALATADRGLAFMQANLVREQDWAAFRDPNSGAIELGASALMLDGLAQRRLATGDPVHDGLMRALGRFMLRLQRADGSFLTFWDRAAGAPNPNYTSKYATGEAFWGLVQLHNLFPGEGWDRPARLVADYLSLHRDTVEGFKFPPWADQWAAYGLADMAAWPLNDANVAYVRDLAARFGFLIRAESQRRDSWFSEAIHGRRARAAGTGTWVEALGSLWRLSGADPRLADLHEKLGERAVCGAGMLMSRQVPEAGAREYSRPELARGAWFTKGVTRMDDQQHALSALLRSEAIIRATAVNQYD